MSTITKEWLQQKIADMEAARDEIPFGLDEDDSNTLAALRIALASLEAEPAIHRWRRVTFEPYGPYPWHYGNFIGFSKPVEGIEDEYYYTAPPAPVSVLDEATPENIEILASTFAPRGVTYQWDRDECNAAADSWNACRAAMLQGAEPVTTANKLPDDFDFDRFNDVVWLEAVASNPHMHSPTTSTIAMVALEVNKRLEAGNYPVIPDGWVACSERMPLIGVPVITCCGDVVQYAAYAWDGKEWQDWYEEYDKLPANTFTHWHPRPAAPQQEVK